MFRSPRRLVPSPGLAVATVAVVLAAGGTATAGSLISSKDVRNNSLTTFDVRNGTLRGADLRNGTVTTAKLSKSTRDALRGQQGAAGQQGAPGPQGAAGPQGLQGIPGTAAAKGDKGDKGDPGQKGDQGDAGTPGTPGAPGPSDAFVVQKASHLVSGPGTRDIIGAGIAVPAGSYVVSAKATAASAGTSNITCELRTGIATTQDSTEYDPQVVGQETSLSLLAPVDLPNGGNIRMLCFDVGGDLTVSDTTVSAIRVGSLSATDL